MKPAVENESDIKEFSRRELLHMAVPKGIFPNKRRLLINKMECTGCALCAQECVTGALAVEGDESINLVFDYQKCDSCGTCIEICPEKCMKLESGKYESSPVTLFEDEFARCTKCGVVIGSKSMLKKLLAKFNVENKNISANLYRCPACKN